MAARLQTRDLRSITIKIDGKIVCTVDTYTSAALGALEARRAHAESVVLDVEGSLLSRGKTRPYSRTDVLPRQLVPIRKIIEQVYAQPLEDGSEVHPALAVADGESEKHRVMSLTAKQTCRGRAKSRTGSTSSKQVRNRYSQGGQ